MLKKISIKQLRKGMFVHEFCGSWIDHPFWKKSFLITSVEDYKSIVASKIAELIIDTQKGLDVLVPVEPAPAPEPEARPAPAEETKVVVRSISAMPVSMDRELNQASQIVAQSKKAVMTMFQEARMGNAVNVESMQPLVEEISESVNRNSGALIGLARLKTKDDYTYMHSIAVCALMIALARQLQLCDEEVKEAGMAGLLHDIGKMMIPNEILSKPGKLTDSEFTTVKQHPLAGYQMLLRNKSVSPVTLDVCLHHHEKMDGTGYPYQYKDEKISLMAKMGAVCDVYDAITSNRPYKKGWCPAESIKKMSEWSGRHFDDRVFQAFVKSVGIYPAGSLVMLKSGRMGVVVEQSDASLLLPIIRIFFSSKSMSYIPAELIDLSKPGHNEKIISREVVSKWGLKNIDRYWLGEAAGQHPSAN
ncbi:putative nucleotidyltransferase with HDIG domain [Oxalobacteraceae bacterium GrIS 2.11]